MKLFTLFGNPVAHSISPRMHNLALKGLGLQGCYTRTQLEDGEQLRFLFEKMRLDGANITVPHKEYAYKQADELDTFAKRIGAVNTLVKREDKLFGYNTDAPGFYKSIQSFGKIENALILGAGGTAKAIANILSDNNIDLHILNRSAKRLDYFKQNGFSCSSWEDFIPKNYDLIINTTSAGLKDNHYPLPEVLLTTLFKKARFAYDVVYNKQTPFLIFAKSNGLIYKDGAEMLLYQGAIAFNLFYDNSHSETTITNYMREAFSL